MTLHHLSTARQIWRSSWWGDWKMHLLCIRWIWRGLGNVSLPTTLAGRVGCSGRLFLLKMLVIQQLWLGNLWSSNHCGGLLKKSISCADCVGMSSLVSVSFIAFCLASCNDEVVNIPVIFLASFTLSRMCECSFWLSQCLGVSGVSAVCLTRMHTVCRFYIQYVCLPCTSAELKHSGLLMF